MKFALEGLAETLAQEVDFGVRFLIAEPGAFRTGLVDRDAAYLSEPLPEYQATVGPTRAYVRTGEGSQPGDPAKAARAILTTLDAPAPPLRLVLGDAVDSVQARLASMTDELVRWEAARPRSPRRDPFRRESDAATRR